MPASADVRNCAPRVLIDGTGVHAPPLPQATGGPVHVVAQRRQRSRLGPHRRAVRTRWPRDHPRLLRSPVPARTPRGPALKPRPATAELPNMPTASIVTSWYTVVSALIARVRRLDHAGHRGARATNASGGATSRARALAGITAYGEIPTASAAAHRRRAARPALRRALTGQGRSRYLPGTTRRRWRRAALRRLRPPVRRRPPHGRERAACRWKAPVIEEDHEMNQGDLYRRLSEFTRDRNALADQLRTATLPTRHRRVARSAASGNGRPRSPASTRRRTLNRIATAPQDLACPDNVGENSPSPLS